MKQNFCHVSLKPNSSQNVAEDFFFIVFTQTFEFVPVTFTKMAPVGSINSGSDLSGRGNHF